MTPLLELHRLTLRFAGITALSDVSLNVPEKSIFAVIGPNGAGKTSLFNCVSGVYRPQRGDVRLACEKGVRSNFGRGGGDPRSVGEIGSDPFFAGGESLLGLPPHAIAGRGVARMFQNLALFDNLTTLENLLLGAHHAFASRWWHDVLWARRARDEEVRQRAQVEAVIDFLELERYRAYPVGLLPYGVRKRIELGRALCMKPRLLLLDEPAAGLNREETEELATFILDIRSELGITQLLIEHELSLVMDLADRVAVLDFGLKIAEGTPDEVRRDPKVAEAYLGRQAA